MDTTELIKNTLDWVDKRLDLKGEKLTEDQRNYLTFALRQNLVKNLSIAVVSKRFSEQDMIYAAEYGYNYRDTTSFPEKNFDDNCKNNVKQWLTKYD